MTKISEQQVFELARLIEKKAAEIAGIDIIASDYNLVELPDWLENSQTEQVAKWLVDEWGIDPFTADYLCGLPLNLMAMNMLFGIVLRKL